MSSISGTKELISYFNKLEKSIQDDVLDVIEETTLGIQREAIRNAPAAGDELKTTYGTQKINTGINQYIGAKFENQGLTGTVFIESGASLLAIYVEFGCGSSAAGYVPTLPKEWQDIAKKYYINGKGTLIRQPYMLPAFFHYEPIYLKRLKEVLAKKR